MGKPTICIDQNKGADQLRSKCEADQCVYFRYMDITILLLSKSKISSLYPSSVTVQPSLCRTWSKIVGFLTHGLKFYFQQNSNWNDERCEYKIGGYICKAPKIPVSSTQGPFQIGCPKVRLFLNERRMKI